jgi:hypothetical protein
MAVEKIMINSPGMTPAFKQRYANPTVGRSIILTKAFIVSLAFTESAMGGDIL